MTAAPLDVLLEGGVVVDGTGQPRFRADVGIQGDVIAYVGTDEGVAARTTVDVSGQVVAPGIIDIHTHSDFTMLEERHGRSALRQGVTTEVVGNCGQSYAPISDLNADGLTQRSLAWQPGVRVDWQNVDQYLQRVREGTGTNCYYLVGHAAIRSAVMGFDDRPARSEEVRAMVRLAEQALDHGARGLSFGLEYPPTRRADVSELSALATVVGRHDAFLGCHMRNRDEHYEQSTAEILRACRDAQATLQLSHLMAKPGHAPGATERVLDQLQEVRRAGLDVEADMIPFDTGPGLATAFLPGWALEGGATGTLRRLKDPKLRARIHDDNDRYWRFAATGAWDRVTLAYSSAHPEWVGESLDVLGQRLGTDAYDALLQLFEDEGEGMGRVTVNGRLFSEQHVRDCMTHPLFTIGSDGWRGTRDGGPGEVAHHPNCWGWVPLVLGHYVREEGVLSLEQAIAKMTGRSAERLGLERRGLVRTSYAADLVVFDADAVSTDSSYRTPARNPRGISAVYVNGQHAVANGAVTGALAGQVL
ncbi:amidohydrolase family protein [Actinopolymorpha sp. B17G11]|uniref:N-acyl-D-amino-acid deacylase family protein n=1 Tax=Actinopolymorpha sp. B17G11 TaxID=3160861 RepID=UPI0032E3ADC9